MERALMPVGLAGATGDKDWSTHDSFAPPGRHAMITARYWPTLMLMLACGAAHADSLDDRWAVGLGAFLLATDTTVRVDTATIRGTPVDVEHDLGFRNRTSFRADAYWRFLSRHKLRLMFFDQPRSADRTITKQIVFNGQTYLVNTQLSARFDTRVAEAAYEYAFLRGEHYELSGSAGLYDLNFKLSLAAVGNSASLSGATRADANGPLPVFGLHYLWQFTPQFNLDAMVQLFTIKVSPYDGNIEDYNISLVYMPWKNFGAGVGWNEFITHLNVDSSNFSGHLAWRYGGARLFVRLSF